jgi:hypothetical protein
VYTIVGGQQLQRYHLVSWVKAPGNEHVADRNYQFLNETALADVSNPDRHRTAVVDAMNTIYGCGATGRELALLARNDRALQIVCWPGVPGEFACGEEYPGFVHPTIMWDPYKTFQYYARSSAKTKTGGVIFMRAVMPAWMVLAHELGHFNHYRTQHHWFVSCLQNHDIAGIEARNLTDHEQPLQKAVNLPLRLQYQDFVGGSNENLAGSTTIGDFGAGSNPILSAELRAACVELQRRVQEAEARGATPKQGIKTVALGEVPCDKCGNSFPKMKLMQHRVTCQGQLASGD